MNLEKAEKLCESFPDWVSTGHLANEFRASATGALETIKWFINSLYNKDYMIISPEELKKINGMTVFADIHGQNPFKPDKL